MLNCAATSPAARHFAPKSSDMSDIAPILSQFALWTRQGVRCMVLTSGNAQVAFLKQRLITAGLCARARPKKGAFLLNDAFELDGRFDRLVSRRAGQWARSEWRGLAARSEGRSDSNCWRPEH
jgi:hypothetical protein